MKDKAIAKFKTDGDISGKDLVFRVSIYIMQVAGDGCMATGTTLI